MSNVNLNTKLPVSADIVWQTIGGFSSIAQWHPAIESSEETSEDGATIRTLTLAGGAGTVVEKLETLNDKERSCTYSIVSSPMPLSNYEATLRVRADGPMSCTVEWSSQFDAEGASENDAAAAVRQVYEAGFENLKRMFGGS
ncbi:MAG: SRPBCC family protein [Alphaproteobacteria bacterium]